MGRRSVRAAATLGIIGGIGSIGLGPAGCLTEGRVLWLTESSSTTAVASTEPLVPATTRSDDTTGTELSTTGGSSGPVTMTGAETTGGIAEVTSNVGGTTSGTGETGQDGCTVRRGGDVLLIDDLEDGDRFLPGHDGRIGWWWMHNDGTPGEQFPTGTFAPTDLDAANGQFSARTYGSGFGIWGASLSVTLNEECPYDASAFAGVEFWARGTGEVRVRLTTVATVPSDLQSGMCLEGCWDDYGAEISLGEAWARYTITWDELSQEGWGDPVAFDPATLVAIMWHDSDSSTDFDIWLDDVAFLAEAPGG